MMTTAKRYSDWKKDYPVYRKIISTDDYGAQKWTYEEGDTVHTMFVPVSDEITIKEYGIDVKDLLQAVIYETEASIRPFYRFLIDNAWYETIKIEQWMTHRRITVKKVISDGD